MSEYPKTMIGNSGVLVLFESERSGVVVKASRAFDLGYRSNNWNIANFKDIDNRTIKPRKLNINK